MNAYKVTFVVLGLIYLAITVLGFFAGGLSSAIGTMGMLWCGLGWSMVNRLLS